MSVKKVYQIKEYGSFICEKEIAGYETLPGPIFKRLENFILTNRSKDTDALELMGISAKKGVGKIITARNYVGIITLNDGTTIEILPKIHSAVEDDELGNRTKRVLIDMLKTLRKVPYKSFQTSHVNIEKMNIFEIFIRLFVDEVFFIVKRGLQCSYETVEENTQFFKGKMLFSEQMKWNHSHRERSYVEYDAFTANRPENKLLKATLLYLWKRSTSSKNKSDIKILLNAFTNVETSTDYQGDFAKYIPDRNTKDYSDALMWCRIFLMGKSFTSFAGSEVAVALLFPMETLFESYLAVLLRKRLAGRDFSVSVQDRTYHLFDEPEKKFLLKPDIVIKRKADGAVFVLDTKWKVLDSGKANYGISQADMYQMFAYQKKYGAKNITLLYPETEKMPLDIPIEFRSDDGVIVRVEFVNLFEGKNCIKKIARQFEKMTDCSVKTAVF